MNQSESVGRAASFASNDLRPNQMSNSAAVKPVSSVENGPVLGLGSL